MPKQALKTAQGLAFTWTTRAALGVGITTGSGFAIALLGEVGGKKRRWSAPCFFYINKLTLGLSYGMGRIDTCVVMRSQEVVNAFKHGQAIFGLDTRFLVCAEEASRSLSTNESATPYSIADGAMVDVSLNGGALLLDRTENHRFYGSEATGESIVSGQVPSPDEFKSLYNALNALLDDAIEM
ncbi:hypothetical protein WJX72_008380 [[Myrmecia] bisecta]|uniref:Ysc84 actin-binding domain-containing protein n=1 Tax=[Myrmecia] bisecta TaxID=41462 RepID=A0AAW1Q570_9CHLO